MQFLWSSVVERVQYLIISFIEISVRADTRSFENLIFDAQEDPELLLNSDVEV